MTFSNHLLAGTLIAVTIEQPLIAVPLAFISHFILDSLPHYGIDGKGIGEALKHKTTFVMEIMGVIGLILLLSTGVYGINTVTFAAIASVLPDIEWAYRYLFFERKGKNSPNTPLTSFHQRVQWCERKWGIVPEILFFTIGYMVLLKIIGS